MSRLWSPFGVRALAVTLLLGGVAGGYYLGEDREAQQHGLEARLAAEAELAELDLLRERNAALMRATVQKRAAERAAARKAAETARAAADRARRAEEASRRAREATVPYTGPIPDSCDEYTGNRQIGCALLLEAGSSLDEMPCLDKLWTKESGWNHRAHNTSSGAYGIPQALPGSKMSSVADDWRTNPATQIKWGLGYIKGRYGTPCKAWAHSHNVGWY